MTLDVGNGNRAQFLVDAGNAAGCDDNIAELSRPAFDHRFDRPAKALTADVADGHARQSRRREQRRRSGVLARPRGGPGAILIAALPPEPAPDSHQIDAGQKDIGRDEICLTGLQPDQRPTDRAQREDNETPACDARPEIGSGHHGGHHCRSGSNKANDRVQFKHLSVSWEVSPRSLRRATAERTPAALRRAGGAQRHASEGAPT